MVWRVLPRPYRLVSVRNLEKAYALRTTNHLVGKNTIETVVI